jgi:hypothetical protein
MNGLLSILSALHEMPRLGRRIKYESIDLFIFVQQKFGYDIVKATLKRQCSSYCIRFASDFTASASVG